jgi:hypothetical protein
MAGSITLIGALLSLFLAPNGGPRGGPIALPIQGEEEERPSYFHRCLSLPLGLARGLAAYTSGLFRPQLQSSETTVLSLSLNNDTAPLERNLMGGSSYVYNQPNALRGAGTNPSQTPTFSSGYSGSRKMGRFRGRNLTQRFLLANESGITTMADFWVEAAMTETAFQQELTSPGGDIDLINHTGPTPGIFDHTGLRKQKRSRAVGRQFRGEPLATPEQTQDSRPLWKQLPVAVILQYGCLALHSTTHDQIFLSYLVS